MSISSFMHAPAGAVVFGAGCSKKAGVSGPLKKATKVVVVTDGGVRAAGLLDRVLASLGDRVVFVFDAVVADGDVAATDTLAARAVAAGADGIVAVGGGSVIDTAKGMGAVMATGKPLAQLEGVMTVRAKLPTLVAVPTTSGTGSESTQFAVIKDAQAGRKRIFMDAALMPAHAFLDPELLVDLPAHITAATGVDALTHALEALASSMRNPVGTACAAEAIRILMVQGALKRALAAPSDIDARGQCLVAANLAGQAVSTSMLGACHAFAHALGAVKGVPHGVANGVFLVPTLQANRAAAGDAYAHLAAILGVASIDAAIEQVRHLVHDVANIPSTLSALGVTQADVEAIACIAQTDPDLPTNPTALDGLALRAIVQARM